MKKLIAAILIVCVAFAGFLTWKNYIPPVAETPTLEVRTVDYEALYATHDPDEIVMNVGGDEITWREFFYYLSANVGYIDNMFAYYGGEADWDMVADETTGETIGENVWTLARQSVGQLHACTLFAKEHGAELTEEQERLLTRSFRTSSSAPAARARPRRTSTNISSPCTPAASCTT